IRRGASGRLHASEGIFSLGKRYRIKTHVWTGGWARGKGARPDWNISAEGSCPGIKHRHSAVNHFVAENSVEHCLRLRRRDFWLQTADSSEPPERDVALAILPARGVSDSLCIGKRKPNIVIASRRNSSEPPFGYADNGEGNVVQLHRATDYFAGATECALPVTIVENGDRGGGWLIVTRLQHAAHRGFHAQRAEKIAGDDLAVDNAGGAIAGEIEAASVGESGDSGKDVGLFNLAKHRLGK